MRYWRFFLLDITAIAVALSLLVATRWITKGLPHGTGQAWTLRLLAVIALAVVGALAAAWFQLRALNHRQKI